ncbi:CHAT domain-containing protein [Herpetosiphon sp. NSE202]|uniref:CHAT domain-containing protein n=1 Tax=Herpetosiphon sp. NSE202 TaxID=3351349 RepID=UPI00363744F3
MSQYLDLRISVDAKQADQYPVRISTADGQEYRATLTLPAEDNPSYSTFNMLLGYGNQSLNQDQVIEFGSLLYNCLLAGDVRTAFISERNRAKAEGKNLRIRLSIEPNEVDVAAIPWEFACDDAGIPLVTKHSICRFLPRNEPLPALSLAADTTLKMLLAWAAPAELDQQLGYSLNIAGEVAAIRQQLQPLIDTKKVELIELAHVTGSRLNLAIEDHQPHVLHFIGHGIMNGNSGQLIFEDSNGKRKDFSALQLSIALEGSPIRLVVLNACQTGTVVTRLLGSIAPALMAVNVPAVVAMQASVADSAANVFASAFYRAFADFKPIDECVSRARRMVIAEGINNVDWGLSTLYMRAKDGLLFTPPSTSGPSNQADASTATALPPNSISNLAGSGNTFNRDVNFGTIQAGHTIQGNTFNGSNVAIGNTVQGNLNQTNTLNQRDNSDLDNLKQRLAIKQRNLQTIESQIESYGIKIPVYLVNQRNNLADEIAALKREIAELSR